MKISDTSFFKISPLILPTPSFLWTKLELPLFSKILKSQSSPLRRGGGGQGVPTMFINVIFLYFSYFFTNASKYLQGKLPS